MAMGPRPGLFIMKFWQGIVEIFIRVIIIVCNIAAFVASSIALSHVLDNLPDPSSLSRSTNDLIESITSLNYNSMILNSISASGLGLGMSVLALFYEVIIIVLRFVNIGLVNHKIKIFLSIDVVISFIVAIVFGIAGILAAYLASLWADLADNTTLSTMPNFGSLPRTHDVLAATAGTNLGCALFTSFVMGWMALFLIQNWNRKVVKETVKGAVL